MSRANKHMAMNKYVYRHRLLSDLAEYMVMFKRRYYPATRDPDIERKVAGFISDKGRKMIVEAYDKNNDVQIQPEAGQPNCEKFLATDCAILLSAMLDHVADGHAQSMAGYRPQRVVLYPITIRGPANLYYILARIGTGTGFIGYHWSVVRKLTYCNTYAERTTVSLLGNGNQLLFRLAMVLGVDATEEKVFGKIAVISRNNMMVGGLLTEPFIDSVQVLSPGMVANKWRNSANMEIAYDPAPLPLIWDGNTKTLRITVFRPVYGQQSARIVGEAVKSILAGDDVTLDLCGNTGGHTRTAYAIFSDLMGGVAIQSANMDANSTQSIMVALSVLCESAVDDDDFDEKIEVLRYQYDSDPPTINSVLRNDVNIGRINREFDKNDRIGSYTVVSDYDTYSASFVFQILCAGCMKAQSEHKEDWGRVPKISKITTPGYSRNPQYGNPSASRMGAIRVTMPWGGKRRDVVDMTFRNNISVIANSEMLERFGNSDVFATYGEEAKRIVTSCLGKIEQVDDSIPAAPITAAMREVPIQAVIPEESKVPM
jgi:hypothetical protein